MARQKADPESTEGLLAAARKKYKALLSKANRLERNAADARATADELKTEVAELLEKLAEETRNGD